MKIGIVGYGNLGRGVEAAVTNACDMELAGVFTRRDPGSVKIASAAPVLPYSALESAELQSDIDVLVLCGGSATDLPTMTPELASRYNVIDSYDNHANIPEHFANVDASAIEAGKVAIISCGWDPGYFSIARIYADAALPDGKSYTFWGKGVSQGHSDAIRRIEGVIDARQYTIPVDAALDRVRGGEHPEFSKREMHLRECFVVAEEGADRERIEREIVTMPDYFEPYDTIVHFVSLEELKSEHSGLPHGGFVIRSGVTGYPGADGGCGAEGTEDKCDADGMKAGSCDCARYNNTIEYSLKLESNPYFTGSILVAAARAACRMNQEGQSGARTLFDVPPAYLSHQSRDELLAHML